MASKHDKRSSSALDPMMAGFAAGAAAFIIYAMPQAKFDEFVSLSGLPMILQPSPRRSNACSPIATCGPNAGRPRAGSSRRIVTGRQIFRVTLPFIKS